MIIQCPACKTKFRFDEREVADPQGVSFRCSRCHHVFAATSVLPRPVVAREPIITEPLISERRREEPPEEEEVTPEVASVAEVRKKKSGLWVWVTVTALLVMALLAFVITLYVPVGKLAHYLPIVGKKMEEAARVPQSAAAQVKIIDLRQHFVENPVVGKIRVVQGTAVNTSSKFMTRIKVKAELYDVLDVRVMESFSYCGNLLTDQELMTTLEEDIMKRLQQPLGTEVSTEKVPPQGMVPFMIVFLREPPGVAKTMVQPVDAEFFLQ